jgi:hypothetical protein
MKTYIKHLVECHCSLKIFDNNQKIIYHKFPVFSVFDESDSIEEKYVMCNNCDIIHKVEDVCKSEIKWGKEALKTLVCTKEDIKFNFKNYEKENVSDLLELHDVDIADWELVNFLIEENQAGQIVLDRKEIENNISYKVLYINESGNIKIKNEITQRYI